MDSMTTPTQATHGELPRGHAIAPRQQTGGDQIGTTKAPATTQKATTHPDDKTTAMNPTGTTEGSGGQMFKASSSLQLAAILAYATALMFL